jgi:surface protein
MPGMFEECESLSVLDISAWDTSAVEPHASNQGHPFARAFTGCIALTNLDVSNWCVLDIVAYYTPAGFAYQAPFANDPDNLPVWGTCPTGGQSTSASFASDTLVLPHSTYDIDEPVVAVRIPRIREYDLFGEGKPSGKHAIAWDLIVKNNQWQQLGLYAWKNEWFNGRNSKNREFDIVASRDNLQPNWILEVDDLKFILQLVGLPSAEYEPHGLTMRGLQQGSVIDWRDFLIFYRWLQLGKPRSWEIYNKLKELFPTACRLPPERYEVIGSIPLDELEISQTIENL